MAKGKGGAALALIALLIGAGGAGFAFYTWFTQPDVPQFWGIMDEDIVIPPYLDYGSVITLEFDLTGNYTLHLLYTGSAKILPNPSTFADTLFYFAINGERLLAPFTRAGPYEGNDTYDYIPVTLQHVIVNAGAGHFNITVLAMNEIVGNFVRSNCLTVTAYPI
jgi:hypothetical protein